MKRDIIRSNKVDTSDFSGGSLFRYIGAAAVLGAVGYGLYRYRFKIQEFLSENGIETPWMTGSVEETFKSGVSKVSGALKHETNRSANLS